MCILPNFATSDLKEIEQKGKKATKKAEAETVEMIVPEQLTTEKALRE
jgi:hypothetical protein